MIDPIQMLQTQASQTAGLFNSINATTTQLYNARIQVQSSQLAMANNQAQLMEQSRMNDARLLETGQQMAIRSREMQQQEKEWAFQERMRPMREQNEELIFKSRLMEHVDRQIAPQMGDIRGEFAGMILESPSLSMDAQNAYMGAIADITEQFEQNPNLDVRSAIEAKKQELRGWVSEKKKAMEPKQIKVELPIFGEVFSFDDPRSMFDKKQLADPTQAAKIYESFGGTGTEFLRRHDPTYKRMVDASYQQMMITGTPDKNFALLDDSQQKSVLEMAGKKELEGTLTTQIKSYLDMYGDMTRTEDSRKFNAEGIKSIEQEIMSLNSELSSLRGIKKDDQPPQLTEEQKRRAAAQQKTIDSDSVSPSYSDIPQEVVQSRYIKDVETTAYKKLTEDLKIPLPDKVKDYLNPENQKSGEDYQRSIFPTTFMMQEGGDYSEKDIIEIAQNEKVKDAVIKYLKGEDISESVKNIEQFKKLKFKHIQSKMNRVDEPRFKGSLKPVKDLAEEFYFKPTKDKTTNDKKEEVLRLREILPNILFALAKP